MRLSYPPDYYGSLPEGRDRFHWKNIPGTLQNSEGAATISEADPGGEGLSPRVETHRSAGPGFLPTATRG
jgi:hypothetical protein